jgi:peptide deformylase
VTVYGLNEAGEEVDFQLGGVASRMFQHEIDHLDGLLMIDRLDPTERRAALDEVARINLREAAYQRDRSRRRIFR